MKYSEFQPTGFDVKGLGIPDRQDWICAGFRSRDSSILEESNWAMILQDLPESDNVEIHRFGHWACGWFELILVRPDTKQSSIAEELEGALSDYPVLSDDDYSERQWNAIYDYWESLSMSERIAYCVDNGESIFSARRERIPDGVYQELCDNIY